MSEVRDEVVRLVAGRWPGCRLEALAGDASGRRFHRVRLSGGATLVVMDYGRPFEGETDDVRLNRIFRAAGLPVARILAIEPRSGCVVLEDLGDRLLQEVLADPETSAVERLGWHRRAVELAVRVASDGTPALARSERAAGPALDAERFRFEMDFFLEHYVGRLLGLEPSSALREELHDLAEHAAATPIRVLCHRDFHSRNLVVRNDGSLAMVDIQDARWGPDAYDLASLLRDAYVDVDEEAVDTLIEAYREGLGRETDAAAFRRRFDVVALQRMVKALGTFGYQAAVLGRRHYLRAVPRTVRRILALGPRIGWYREIEACLER